MTVTPRSRRIASASGVVGPLLIPHLLSEVADGLIERIHTPPGRAADDQ
jgi:hypothetical protein